jgi:hypothetical protein
MGALPMQSLAMHVRVMQGAKGEQISVRLEPELRAAVERAAEREHRTLSGQIRHLVALAYQQRQQRGQEAA